GCGGGGVLGRSGYIGLAVGRPRNAGCWLAQPLSRENGTEVHRHQPCCEGFHALPFNRCAAVSVTVQPDLPSRRAQRPRRSSVVFSIRPSEVPATSGRAVATNRFEWCRGPRSRDAGTAECFEGSWTPSR